MGSDGTPAPAHRNEGAVAALLLVGRQPVEPGCGCRPPGLLAAVDMPRGLLGVAGKPRADIERTVRTNGVGVPPMDLARPHVDAIGRRKATPARLVAQKLHLVVEEVAAVAGAGGGASAGACHAGPVQRFAAA